MWVGFDREGVWVDGGWSFLWWKAKPRSVPWEELKVYSDRGTLYLESKSDVRCRSDINFNETENAMVLDNVVRFLFERDNWKRLKEYRPRGS